MFTYDTRPVELGQVVYVHIVLKPETTKRSDRNRELVIDSLSICVRERKSELEARGDIFHANTRCTALEMTAIIV